MAVRRMTWAEYSAWMAVTSKAEAIRQRLALLDLCYASTGGDGLKQRLEQLNGDQ